MQCNQNRPPILALTKHHITHLITAVASPPDTSHTRRVASVESFANDVSVEQHSTTIGQLFRCFEEREKKKTKKDRNAALIFSHSDTHEAQMMAHLILGMGLLANSAHQ